VVVTVGTFQAGDNANVIADTCTMSGTVRTFLPQLRELAERRLKEIVNGTAAMLGATVSIRYDRGYPAVINSEREAAIAWEAAVAAVGAEQVERMKPTMGGEDFSYYLQQVPGAFIFVGAGNPEKGAAYPHHHPRFDIDEQAMLISAEVLGRTALRYMQVTGGDGA